MTHTELEQEYVKETGSSVHSYGLETQFTKGFVKWLSKRLEKAERTEFKLLHEYCNEKEFKIFMLKVYNDWRNNPDKTAIDYMLEQIFSHYILIPKE